MVMPQTIHFMDGMDSLFDRFVDFSGHLKDRGVVRILIHSEDDPMTSPPYLPLGLDFDAWFHDHWDGEGPFSLDLALKYAGGDHAAAAHWHMANTRFTLTEYLRLTGPVAEVRPPQPGAVSRGAGRPIARQTVA